MSEKKAIKVGIWGLGRAGYSMHCKELDAYADEFKVVAGCDLEQERLDRLKTRYPECRVYLDGNEFLSDSEVELVAVAVRSPLHVDYALRALAAGKMVFERHDRIPEKSEKATRPVRAATSGHYAQKKESYAYKYLFFN